MDTMLVAILVLALWLATTEPRADDTPRHRSGFDDRRASEPTSATPET